MRVGLAAPIRIIVLDFPALRIITRPDVELAGWVFEDGDPECFFSVQAPRVGFEPTTNRLTAGCSTVELSGKVSTKRPQRDPIQSSAALL